MNNFSNIKTRKDNLVIQEFENETLIYDLNNHKAFCLNKHSAVIWNLCDGNNSVLEISEKMSASLQELISEDFVILAINQFHKNNLLENDREINQYFSADFSRRDVIKKVGLSTMIALPIISSVVVPQVVSAQSIAGLGQTCQIGIPASCLSGNCLNSGGSGICCASTSDQANSPGYTICTNDPDENAFALRCCSGTAQLSVTQSCPTIGQNRYTCSPY